MSVNNDNLRLVSRYLDGALTSDEVSKLGTMLVEDPQLADLFALFSLTHCQVRELFAEDRLHDILEQTNVGAPSFPPNKPDWQHAGMAEMSRPETRRLSWIARVGMGIAAVLLVAIGMFSWLLPQQAPAIVERVDNNPYASEQQLVSAATVTRMTDCNWTDDDGSLSLGDQLSPGTHVDLASGVLRLTFASGAEVVLDGPCKFVVKSSMEGYLKKGNIIANVPRRAFTFAIRIPGIDFVDLGTDFGICIDDQGKSELHVFDGEVIYRQDTENRKSTDVVHVAKDEAVRFDSPLDEARNIVVNRELFSPHFDLRQGHFRDLDLPVQRDLTLWLSADQGLDIDREGRVISWHDRVCRGNKVAEDAFQMTPSERPFLIKSVINGLPVVRFDGQDDYMLTTPIETTDNQTVFIVCQYAAAALSDDRIHGGQILNYDGPPTRELTSTLAPGVLQIGEPLLEEEFRPSIVSAQVFAGFIGKTMVETGRVDTNPVGIDRPVVICYHYDYRNRKAKIMLNGRICDEAQAFAPAGLTSSKVIGRHAWKELFFHGDLAELLIFNDALDSNELQSLTQFLEEKYGVPME